MTNYVGSHGLQPGLDEEAMRYYQEGLRYVNGDQSQTVWFHLWLSRYYARTLRSGLALPYFKKELAYWEHSGRTFEAIIAYAEMAQMNGNVGQLALRDHYQKKALELAETYFILGERPSDGEQWVQYMNLLTSRMDILAQSGNTETMLPLWKKIELINQRFLAPKYIAYVQAAREFAWGGI